MAIAEDPSKRTDRARCVFAAYQAVAVAAASGAFAALFFDFVTAGFLAVFTGASFAAARFAVAFFAATGAVFAAWNAAQRFLVASEIAFRPAALILRFGFAASDVSGAVASDSPRILAHRRCCASFIRRRAAAENFRRLSVCVSGVTAGVRLVPPASMARSSSIWVSIRVFCASNPVIAALMISFVSFGGM
jgi:hypothetical protein